MCATKHHNVTGDYKGALQVSPKVLVGLAYLRLGFVTPIVGEVSLGPLGNAHHYKPCKHCNERVSCEMMYYGTSKETCR